MLKTKICSKCNEEKILSCDYFGKRKDSKDGFRSECKVCLKIQRKEYYDNNKEYYYNKSKIWKNNNPNKVKISNDKWIKCNKGKVNNYGVKFRESNRKKLSEKQREYYKNNKEKVKIQNKKSNDKRKDEITIYNKSYYKNNLEKEKQRCLKWSKENSEKVNMIAQKRRNLKKEVISTLTLEQWKIIKNHFNHVCCYCGKDKPLAQEHFIPLSRGGEYTQYNIIPSCKSCNSSKSTKDFLKWYPKYEHYSKKREKFILNHLGYKQ